MSTVEVEQLLRGLPTRTLDAKHEAELVAALLQAAAAPRDAWWRRPVRLWQALAACAAVAALSIGVTAAWRSASGADDRSAAAGGEPVRARVETALFAAHPRVAGRVDLGGWRILATNATGD